MTVRESADRLRRIKGGESFGNVYGVSYETHDTPHGAVTFFAPIVLEHYLSDERSVIAAFLAEHPADEDEALSTPAAIDWLDSLSRVGGDLSMFTVRACDDGMHLVSGDWVSPHVATKGDVRRLAAVLGIDLQEPRQ
jgi:hypothetical protein